MDQAQSARKVITRHFIGSVLIYGALLVHSALALFSLGTRRTYRMSWADAAQIVMGVVIPILLIAHIVHTRVSHEVFDLNDKMGYIMVVIYGHIQGYKQSALLLIVWFHGCLGLHMWLRSRRWWNRSFPTFVGFSVLVPAFALAGFMVEGRRLSALFKQEAARQQMIEEYNWPDRDMFHWLINLSDWLLRGFVVMLLAIGLIYVVRQILRKRTSVRIKYVGGPEIDAPKGHTLLEMSRAHGVPHTSMCGGKGRCTTCRVVVEEGLENLPPPSEAELKSLRAAGASANMRLACQIRPSHDATVFRVFEPDGKRKRAHASQGEERTLALLFLDIRGFTARTTGQLPYDVVYLLNRFFDAVVPAVVNAGGKIDKYLGDGFLAVFEDQSPTLSAKAALKAVAEISQALETFNAKLESEGQQPVRIGMGAHLGNVVLGEIGAMGKAPRTLIGDTVNTASRLEAATKEYKVQSFLSAPLLDAAEYKIPTKHMTILSLRGVTQSLPALALMPDSKLTQHLEELHSVSEKELVH